MNALVVPVLAVVLPLAEQAPAPEDIKPGWIGLGFVVALFVITLLLWTNMKKQIRKIDFDEDAPGSDASSAARTSPSPPQAAAPPAPPAAPASPEAADGPTQRDR